MNDRFLIAYDLQFFGDEKTEEATSKKLSDTRNEGKVAKSQELAHGVELVAMFIIIRLTTRFMAQNFIGFFRWIYNGVILDAVATVRNGPSAQDTHILLMNVIIRMIVILLPFFIVGFVVAFLSNGLQFQFKITFKPLQPKFSKFNPISGMKRIFSLQSMFNLGLAIVKITLISVIAYNAIVDHVSELFILYELDLNQGLALVGDLVISTGLRISLVYLLVGAVDLIYQRHKFKKDTKMTKQEVKDEYKNQEGDPQIKGQQRQRMREASQRRMMKDVPNADVVITNPTHFAVAIRYVKDVMAAPIVVAKGADDVAAQIRRVAEENDVPIMQNKALARNLYYFVDLNKMIPPELFEAVAEILAAVYRQRGDMQ